MEKPHDLANRVHALLRVHNARVLIAGTVVTEEVLVLRKYHAAIGERKRNLLGVGSRDQISIGCCRDIQATEPKSVGDGVVNILIKMKLDHHPAPSPLVSVLAGPGR